MGLQPDHRLIGAKVRHLRGGMPGGARGQFVTLDQNDIAPAFLGKMIERLATGDATADDNNPGSRFHGPRLRFKSKK
jgi:hypothetical protein